MPESLWKARSPRSRKSHETPDMKRFAFRLETLLRHRTNLEEKGRNELLRLVSLLQRKYGQLQLLQDKNHATLLELAEKKIANAEHAEIGWFYAYLDRLRLEME